MTTASLTGTDVRLRNAVVRQLDWDPEVDDSAIGVAAREGVVTLTGFIDSYAGKLAAERVVKHTMGKCLDCHRQRKATDDCAACHY